MTVDIPEIVRHADGEIAGKIRLQKIVYLLNRLDYEVGFPFEYHHYGPYSRELAEKVEDEVHAQTLTQNIKRRYSDGVPYVVYRATEKTCSADDARLSAFVKKMNAYSSTVLELAATIDWLVQVENYKDWRSELQVRKGAKTAGGRTEKALELLSQLGLSPAA
jgi:uncharacterized protein